jgi:hypothetical protein
VPVVGERAGMSEDPCRDRQLGRRLLTDQHVAPAALRRAGA